MIDRLRAAALRLRETADGLYERLTFPPPAQDPVSVNMTEQAAVMARRAVDFVLAWRRQIEDTADALALQLTAYRIAESTNRDRFT